jgi:hypothetical protein
MTVPPAQCAKPPVPTAELPEIVHPVATKEPPRASTTPPSFFTGSAPLLSPTAQSVNQQRLAAKVPPTLAMDTTPPLPFVTLPFATFMLCMETLPPSTLNSRPLCIRSMTLVAPWLFTAAPSITTTLPAPMEIPLPPPRLPVLQSKVPEANTYVVGVVCAWMLDASVEQPCAWLTDTRLADATQAVEAAHTLEPTLTHVLDVAPAARVPCWSAHAVHDEDPSALCHFPWGHAVHAAAPADGEN